MEEGKNGFDLLKLYKDSLVRLTLEKEKAESIDRNISFPLMKSFLAGEEIPLIWNQNYLSPFLIHDLINDVYYPFCFFEIEKMSSTSIKKKEKNPYFNSAALFFLKENGLNLKDIISTIEISNLYFVLQEKISSKMLMNKFELIPCLLQCEMECIEYSLNFDFLNDYLYNPNFDGKYQKYDALFKEIKDNKKDKEIQEESLGFLSSFQVAIRQADAYGGTKIRALDSLLLDAFIDSFLLEKKGSRILFVSKKKEDILSIFNSSVFIRLADKEEIKSDIDDIKSNLHMRKKQQFLSFENKREESYSFLKQFKDKEYLEELPEKNVHLIPFDFSEYTKEDYIKDKDFFNVLDSLKSLRNSTISNHPYYGLYSNKEKENYDSLQLLLMKLVKELEEMMKEVKENEILEKYNISCCSLSELSTLIEDGKMLSQYNGFPRKYFKIQPDMENQYPLSYLKHSYQAISSSKLLILNFCKEAIFRIDLKKYISYYESKNIIKKEIAKRKILSFVKVKKDTDLISLIRVLKSYLYNEENYRKILPQYIQVYGDSVANMNGVVEIESNISYINRVREYQKKNPSFDLEQPFFKRCLKDRDFRASVMNFIDAISAVYNSIVNDLKAYQIFYRELSISYLNDLSLDNLLFKFKAERLYRYEDFKEYCLFNEKKTQASSLLNLSLQRYRKQNLSLSTLKDDFIYSLVYFSYQQSKIKFEPFESDYRKIKTQFYQESRCEKEYHDYDCFCKFKENSPNSIVLASKDELFSYEEDEFDYIVVLNSSVFSNEEILSCYRVGKCHLFVEYDSLQDKRILGYHENVLSLDSVIKRELLFSSLDERLIALLRDDCLNHQTVLQVNETGFPLSFEYHNRKYGLLPDVLLTGDMTPDYVMELRDFMSVYEDMTLIVLDTYAYLFKDENFFDFL